MKGNQDLQKTLHIDDHNQSELKFICTTIYWSKCEWPNLMLPYNTSNYWAKKRRNEYETLLIPNKNGSQEIFLKYFTESFWKHSAAIEYSKAYLWSNELSILSNSYHYWTKPAALVNPLHHSPSLFVCLSSLYENSMASSCLADSKSRNLQIKSPLLTLLMVILN